MDELALIDIVRGVLQPSESSEDPTLRLGLEVAESGARCVISLPPGTVEPRGAGDSVDVDIRLRTEVIERFANRSIDSARLARAIETGELTLTSEIEPAQLLRSLEVIDRFVVPLMGADETGDASDA